MQTSSWTEVQQRAEQPGSQVLARVRDELAASNRALRASRKRVADPRNDIGSSSMSFEEFGEWLANTRAGAGIAVTERTAMAISTVFACVALIGGAVSSMPLHFYKRGEDNERERYIPDEWWMFNEQPFPCWSAATAWEYALASLLLQGDSFWRIHRASRLSPKITGFEPQHPNTTTVRRVDDRLEYKFTPQPSQAAASPGVKPIVLDQDDVLHVAGPGFDGLRGLSQISNALGTIGGTALASDQYSAAFFRNQARPDYALQTDARVDEPQIENLRSQLFDKHGGANAWKPIILQGGLKVQPITFSAKDAELTVQRRLGVEEMARLFGVPPFMIGHTEKTTSWGTGIGEMGIQFVKYTLSRHLVKFEQEINRKVFRRLGNRFCEFLTAGLERGDLTNRYAAYRVGLGRAGEPAFLTLKEVRKAENLSAAGTAELEQAAKDAAAAAQKQQEQQQQQQQGEGKTKDDEGKK